MAVLAMLIIVVGVGRVLFGLKGWEFYVYNWAFWAKMAAFALVGLLSIQPTIRLHRAGARPRPAIRPSRSPTPRSAPSAPICTAEVAVFLPDPDLRRHHGARHRLLIGAPPWFRAAPVRPAARVCCWSSPPPCRCRRSRSAGIRAGAPCRHSGRAGSASDARGEDTRSG